MATGNTIEARLRIAAQVQDAIRDLKALKAEVLATGAATKQAARDGGTGGGATGAQQEREAVRRTSEERKRDRAAEAQARREAATARQAERAAARQAEAELKKQRGTEREELRRKAAAEREAAREIRGAANQQKQAYAQLPAQISDITTSLASGMPIWQVATQQGLQIKDSFGGWAGAGRGLLSVLTPMRLVMGGLGLAIGAVAIAAISAFRDTDRLNKAVALTGNTAGTTSGQINALAVQLASEYNTSIGSVRDSLAQLLETGGQTGTTLEATARAVTAYRKVTGASASEAVKFFGGQRDAVLEWATKSNQAYNFLTAAQIEHIRTLQSQGRETEAVRLVNEELAKTLEQRTANSLSDLEKWWNRVQEAASKAWEAMKGAVNGGSPEQDVEFLRRRIAELEKVEKALARLQKRPVEETGPLAAARAELKALEDLLNRDKVRRAERAAEQQAEQAEIEKGSKARVDGELQLEADAARRRLALKLRAIDQEQQAVELGAERQLFAETEKNLELNDLEQQRIQARARTVKELLNIESRRKTDTPDQARQKASAINALQVQLIELEGQLGAAGAKAQQLLAGEATEQARAWEQAWRDASAKVRELAAENSAAAAGRIADPAERARRAAELASEQQQRELDAQRRALRLRIDLTLDPGQAAELQRQLDALTTEGNLRIGETQRRARFESLRQQLEQQTEVLSLQEQEINGLVERGALTTEDAEKRKLAARQAQVPVLEQILALLKEVADGASVTEQNQVKAAENSTRAWADFRTELGRAAEQQAVGDLATMLTDIETGAKSGKEALLDMVRSFARAMLNLINQRIAERLVGQLGQVIGTFGNSGGSLGSGSVGGGNSGFVDYTPGTGATTASAGGPTKSIAGAGAGLTVNIPVTVNGARGDDKQLAEATSDLRKRMRAVVDEWAVEQSRSGGILVRN